MQTTSSALDDHEPKSWVKIALIATLVALPLLAVIGYALATRTSSSAGASQGGPVATLDWQTLRELNIETGEKSPKLADLDGKKVRLPGFMVPLEDNQQRVTEFLLVSNPQACIHVPAPPANQMVHVRMVGSDEAKMSWGPVWIEGILRISTIGSAYGNASYQILGERSEPYKADF